LPDAKIPEEIDITSDLGAALMGQSLVFLAIPTQFLRSILLEINNLNIFKEKYFISVAKGIENNTLLRPSGIVRDVLGNVTCGVLSGPSHAEEVARSLPATVVVASKNKKFAKRLQLVLNSNRFRVYTNSDVIGVELGGAIKNVVAIASGICEGLGLGDNAKAALLSRGIVEMARLGVALGARKSTFFGLSGIGDLVTTCYSHFSRNREVGFKIGKGQKLQDILKGMDKVVEGVRTTLSLKKLSERFSIDMPITTEVYKMLYEGKKPIQAVQDLMMRQPKSEMEDLV
jgi:glycerol-3-phosphate dehydrogenase (NAD(P)+)